MLKGRYNVRLVQSEMVTPETSMNMSLAAFLSSLGLESSHLHQIRYVIKGTVHEKN